MTASGVDAGPGVSPWGGVGGATPPPMFENFVFFAWRFMDSFEKF
jgi:hypothetical protein